jgi:acyl carrier protein
MSRTEIYEKLTEVFADIFETELTLSDDMTADEVEDWDSLTHISLIAEVEQVFGMKFQMKEVVNMKNVGEMVDIIARECT